jgi:hypothetical protein
MKKLVITLALSCFVGLGMAASSNSSGCNNCTQGKNKMTHNKPVRKTGKGISHGYYDVTHNKATKFLHINNGNKKYKYRNDV